MTTTRSGATAPPAPIQLRLHDAVLGYRRDDPLAGPFDFDLRAGEWIVVAGPNGAGKSTFVRGLLGTQPLLAGKREVVAEGLRFGYVPQRERLDPIWPLTVFDLVALGAAPLRRPFRRMERALRERVEDLVERVGLAGLEGRPFRDLSGGQQQRALIARALVPQPDVLILDEPANHLDIVGERELVELLATLHATLRPSLAIISHRLGFLLPHADRLVVMRDGRFSSGSLEALRGEGALEGLLEPWMEEGHRRG